MRIEREYVCGLCWKVSSSRKAALAHFASHFRASGRRAGQPEGVSGASDCSDPRSGADNRAALAAKRPIPPRVAGRNTVVRHDQQNGA